MYAVRMLTEFVSTFLLLSYISAQKSFTGEDDQRFAYTSPETATPDMNITVVKGQQAFLPCYVDIDDLESKGITVIWMDKWNNVLFYNREQMLVENSRLNLAVLDKTWRLNIRDVRQRDEGMYRCIVNTKTLRLKYFDLIVYVPPLIDKAASSPDVIADEGTSVYLTCNATGQPQPTITWTKTDRNDPNKTLYVIDHEGSDLTIHNVGRHSDTVYTCTASNGYGNASKYSIGVKVRYKPQVRLGDVKVYKYVGEQVRLTCRIDAYPMDQAYWARDNLQIKSSGGGRIRYQTEEFRGGFVRNLILHFTQIKEEDFGWYKCVSVNTLGREERYMQILSAEQDVYTYRKPTPRRNSQVSSEPLTPRQTGLANKSPAARNPQGDTRRVKSEAVLKKTNSATSLNVSTVCLLFAFFYKLANI